MATKSELAQWIIRLVKDSWQYQETEAIRAEANLVAAKASDAFYKKNDDFYIEDIAHINRLEERAKRERTEANSRKEAYDLLLKEILTIYIK